MNGLIILKARGTTKAVYSDSRDATRKDTPQDMGLPKNKNIALMNMLFKITTRNMSRVRITLLSTGIFLDSFIIIKLHRGNSRIFMPKIFALKISFSIPAKILKHRAHFNSK
jgi:hypothetical protein